MRVPRVRFTVRRMMVAVAVLAVGMGLVALLRGRAAKFQRLAAYHEQAATHLYVEKVGEVCTDGLDDTWDVERVIASRGEGAWLAYRAALHHEGLAAKYAHAAGHPWWPVSSDPTAPPGVDPSFEFDPSVGTRDEKESTGGFR